ncbi:MAG TPA: sugar ABC transporter permease, partial [Planctomycetota bacterium]|nr:sugar ABC transporter permease [Planctomycetota bacterium]
MERAAVHPDAPMSLWRRRYHRAGYWYILPALLLFAFMVAYPIVRSFYLSFFQYSILEPDAARFVGLDNYVKLFTQAPVRQSFRNTLYFTAIFVPPYVVLSLVIAVMLNAVRRGSVFLRTMIFTPVVVSLAVSAVMWTLFYNNKFGLAQKAIAWT